MRVVVDRQGPVLVIQMDRQDRHNAVDESMTEELSTALDLLGDDDDLLVGVLTGGPRVFSAGTDLRAGAGGPTERGGRYGVVRRRRMEPLIAAVEGVALGGGMEMVLACDMVVAARGASFGLPETSLGLIPECGGIFRAPRALPVNVARELLFTGERLTAQRAFELGFVNRIAEDGSALDFATTLAARVAAQGPVALRSLLTALRQIEGSHDDIGWVATEQATAATRSSSDASEGIDAFFAKRPPRWTGK